MSAAFLQLFIRTWGIYRLQWMVICIPADVYNVGNPKLQWMWKNIKCGMLIWKKVHDRWIFLKKCRNCSASAVIQITTRDNQQKRKSLCKRLTQHSIHLTSPKRCSPLNLIKSRPAAVRNWSGVTKRLFQLITLQTVIISRTGFVR